VDEPGPREETVQGRNRLRVARRLVPHQWLVITASVEAEDVLDEAPVRDDLALLEDLKDVLVAKLELPEPG
jgi:hypothetical protein